MNIILIIFDTLRKDCIGVYGEPFWGKVYTPHFDAFSKESLMMTNAWPESLPTLPTRRAIYTGRRVYPFVNSNFNLKGDFFGAPGWGPIPEDQPTLAEILKEHGYRTALISDVYHMFKPSKNFWRGFDQWMFLRGQEKDWYRSGPKLTQEQVDYWLPKEMQNPVTISFIQQCIMNIHDRNKEEDYFAPRVLKESALWLEQNRDAEKFFLTIESFDPHEPWLVPDYYRKMYDKSNGREQVKSGYNKTDKMDPQLLRRTQANYSGEVTMCDRWFGYFMETMRVMGLLDNTLIIFTTDHGHSIGDYNFIGKRGYPSNTSVYEVPVMVRHPEGKGAGKKNNMFMQHTDISAEILSQTGVDINKIQLDGKPFFNNSLKNGKGHRDHITVGWGSAVTVITNKWWFNSKVNGKGVLLYDRTSKDVFNKNVADDNPEIVNKLFKLAVNDAGGKFPEFLLELAEKQTDAPGCSDLVGRKR